MKAITLLDTGPLVAYLNRREHYHAWSRAQMGEVLSPLLTCESVISEALFLLSATPVACDAIFEMLATGDLKVAMSLDDDHAQVAALIRKYADLPMSLADACLVRLSEAFANSVVLTLDSHFTIYRRFGDRPLPLRLPPDRWRD